MPEIITVINSNFSFFVVQETATQSIMARQASFVFFFFPAKRNLNFVNVIIVWTDHKVWVALGMVYLERMFSSQSLTNYMETKFD